MAGMINQLIDILGEQTTRYEELLWLSLEKRDVIITNDVEALQKINHLENMVISQNQRLEKNRLSIVSDMAIALNQKEDELTLAKMIELMEGKEEQLPLIEVRDRIKSVLGELREVNTQNGQLVHNALEHIEFTTNVIRSSLGHQPTVYPGTDDLYMGETGRTYES